MVLSSVRLRLCALAVSAAAIAVPASAEAATGGGAAYPGAPSVAAARCETGDKWRCGAGERLTVRGEGLAEVASVAFVGGPGGRDDAFARPRRTSARSFVVVVPDDARSGRLRVRSDAGVARTRRSVRISARALAGGPQEAVSRRGSGAEMVFPIRGRHDMGRARRTPSAAAATTRATTSSRSAARRWSPSRPARSSRRPITPPPATTWSSRRATAGRTPTCTWAPPRR